MRPLLLVALVAVITNVQAQTIWGGVSIVDDGFYDTIAVDTAGVAYVGDWDLYRASDGATWERILEDVFVRELYTEDDVLYAATLDGVILVEGDVWLQLLDGISLSSLNVGSTYLTIGGSAGQVFQSETAQSWSTLNPTRLYLNDERIRSIAEKDGTIVYSELTDGFTLQVVAGRPGEWVVQPVASGKVVLDEGLFWAVDGVQFYSSPDGRQWSLVTSVPGSFSVSDWVKRGDTIVTADFSGVKATVDGGAVWTDISNGLAAETSVDALTIDSDGYVWALADSLVQKSLNPLAATTGTPIDRTAVVPLEVTIEDLYPNPAAGEVRMELVSPGGEAVVEVFDMLGRKIDLIYKGDAPPGRLDITWDGRTASGQYLIRAVVDGREQSRTVIIR